jgi:hypothetical protein
LDSGDDGNGNTLEDGEDDYDDETATVDSVDFLEPGLREKLKFGNDFHPTFLR